MKARSARAGGRHAAVERGALEPEAEAAAIDDPERDPRDWRMRYRAASTAPLVECLDAASLTAVVKIVARLSGEV